MSSPDAIARGESAIARYQARRAAQREHEAAAPQPTTPRRRRATTNRHRGAGRRHTEDSRANIARSNLNRWASRVDADSLPLLTRARLERGLSTRAAAQLCGVSAATFRRVELGKPVGDAYRSKVEGEFPEVFGG